MRSLALENRLCAARTPRLAGSIESLVTTLKKEMSTQLLVALIGCFGGIVGAIPTYILMRQKKRAEIRKIQAETRKILAEAGKIASDSMHLLPAQSAKVKLLFVAADPVLHGRTKLNLGGEIRAIVQGIRASKHSETIEMEQMWGTRWQDLRHQLLRNAPDVLHFTGMSREEQLIFESETGGADLIATEQFRALLSLFHDRIRLVFINTGQSASICQSLASSVDFVVGATGRLADESAIRFAAAFYEAISDRKTVPEAFDFGLANLTPDDEAGYQLFAVRKGVSAHLLPDPGNKV